MKKLLHVLISLGGFLLLWQIAFWLGEGNEALFPSPLKVYQAFVQLCVEGLPGSTSSMTLPGHIQISLIRFATGYCIAAVSGVVLGLFFGCLPGVFAYVNPVIQVIRPIAPVAFLPFIVLWFGIGDLPAIVIIFIAGFFPILLSTTAAVGHVDVTYLKVAQNFGLSPLETVRKVIFPAAFSQIANSLHLALGTSWIFLVSGEMVGAQSGLGFLIMDTKNCIRMDSLLATMLTIGLIGLLLDSVMKLLERLICQKFGVGERNGG